MVPPLPHAAVAWLPPVLAPAHIRGEQRICGSQDPDGRQSGPLNQSDDVGRFDHDGSRSDESTAATSGTSPTGSERNRVGTTFGVVHLDEGAWS